MIIPLCLRVKVIVDWLSSALDDIVEDIISEVEDEIGAQVLIPAG